MAARPVPGAGDKPQRRVVPGAPPPLRPRLARKEKPRPSCCRRQSTRCKIAALLEKAPANPNPVANGLKVTSQGFGRASRDAGCRRCRRSGPVLRCSCRRCSLHTCSEVISDRINELSAKSKNATITVAIDELKSLLSKVQVAEAGRPVFIQSRYRVRGQGTSGAPAAVPPLFNLFHPNPAGPPSFAPPAHHAACTRDVDRTAGGGRCEDLRPARKWTSGRRRRRCAPDPGQHRAWIQGRSAARRQLSTRSGP